MSLRVLTGVALFGIMAGCGEEGVSQGALLPLEITRVEPTLTFVLPGSEITLFGSGFVGPPTGSTRVIVEGEMEGTALAVAIEVQPESGEELMFTLGPDVLAFFPGTTGQLVGSLRVETMTATGVFSESERVPWNVVLVETIEPSVDPVGWLELFPGSSVEVSGHGLLLSGEGQTVALLIGEFTQAHGDILFLDRVPLVVDAITRNEGSFSIVPEVFGVHSGTFSGRIEFVNEHLSGLSRNALASVAFQFNIGTPRIQYVSKHALRRGQVLQLQGAGFVFPDPELGVGTLLVFEGVFRRSSGAEEDWTGANAKVFFPDKITPDSMDIVVRSLLGTDGQMSGLGSMVGSFDGTISPWLISGSEGAFGIGLPTQLQMLPQRQVVFLKILPGFEDALAQFGLHRVVESVKVRIMEVVHRDYQGVNMEFVFERPDAYDYIEYTVVELGGFDPNNAGLLGLDNTEGKDVGNLRFNDVIGGFNALSEQQGFYAYGGVFVSSFFQFSELHADSDPLMAHPSFDDVFAALAPPLGGTPAREHEFGAAHVAEAIRVLGSLIGNTLSHEIGHALGLANLDNRFHNDGDNPNWIMDAGGYRPFDERAELNGAGPEIFSPTNRQYLEQILPPDGY